MTTAADQTIYGLDGKPVSERDLFKSALADEWVYIRMDDSGRIVCFTRPPVYVMGGWIQGVAGGYFDFVGFTRLGEFDRKSWGGKLSELIAKDSTTHKTIIDLLSWSPEFSGPSDMPYAEEMEEDADRFAGVPFVSETFLYSTLGKDDARSFLTLVNNLVSSLGIDPFEFKRDNDLL